VFAGYVDFLPLLLRAGQIDRYNLLIERLSRHPNPNAKTTTKQAAKNFAIIVNELARLPQRERENMLRCEALMSAAAQYLRHRLADFYIEFQASQKISDQLEIDSLSCIAALSIERPQILRRVLTGAGPEELQLLAASMGVADKYGVVILRRFKSTGARHQRVELDGLENAAKKVIVAFNVGGHWILLYGLAAESLARQNTPSLQS